MDGRHIVLTFSCKGRDEVMARARDLGGKGCLRFPEGYDGRFTTAALIDFESIDALPTLVNFEADVPLELSRRFMRGEICEIENTHLFRVVRDLLSRQARHMRLAEEDRDPTEERGGHWISAR